jgi:hypothetical protein
LVNRKSFVLSEFVFLAGLKFNQPRPRARKPARYFQMPMPELQAAP